MTIKTKLKLKMTLEWPPTVKCHLFTSPESNRFDVWISAAVFKSSYRKYENKYDIKSFIKRKKTFFPLLFCVLCLYYRVTLTSLTET